MNSKKFLNLLDGLNANSDSNDTETDKRIKNQNDKLPITHLLTQLKISIMYNNIKFNINQVPAEIISDVILNDKYEYLPITYINRLAIRDEYYMVGLARKP